MSAKRAKKDTSEQSVHKTAAAQVKITAAKGRPMLTWVGKRPLARVTAFPAQLVERHDALDILGLRQSETDDFEKGMDAYERRMQVLRDLGDSWNRACWEGQPSLEMVTQEQGGLLFHGDNKDVLAFLLGNGFRRAVDLIYIDPPFDSGADYVRKVSLRGEKNGRKIDSQGYTLGEQVQYTDIWANDSYLQFMYERVSLMRELLVARGSIYIQCDPRRSHQLRLIMDEVFGASCFQAEICWRRSTAHSDATFFGAIHDTILFYTASDDPVFNRQHTPHDDSYIESHYASVDESGRRYCLDNITSPHPRPNLTYEWKGCKPPQFGWRYDRETMERLDREGRIYYPPNGGRPRLKRYLDESVGIPLQDIWEDINPVNSQAAESLSYPTQKPERLIDRIVCCSSNPGDLILDCFAGSGTTAAVAQKLGRRWIGCDINKGAVQTAAKRLRSIVDGQIRQALATAEKRRQNHLPGIQDDADAPPKPAQFGFTVWRVNDYDLQIQHNEAVNLACEHIGVLRTRGDSFFDGTRGTNLVKIVPFSHPLAPLDLEELKRELEARPDEDRNLTLVCLGIEVAAKAWIDDWNRLRKGAKRINRIDVVELRTDSKYGKFIKHEPATVRVKCSRKNGRIRIEIVDFISPTIIERLEQPGGLIKAKIDDWRAMVDCVMIDTAHDGQVFNVVLADVPEKKSDLVEGSYEIPFPSQKTTVAIKIIDMLGEEVLVTQEV
jgi:adenine-specific DNA-methyltransferase